MSALTAWTDAERACFNFLIDILDGREGKNAFLGDALPAYELNIWAFQLAGGPTQDQNYQRATPATSWLVNGQLMGQFEKRETAQEAAGQIMLNMPAYKNGDNAQSCSQANRGIPPNVNFFEMTEFPSLDSRPLSVDSRKDVEITVWMLFMPFRCQFSNVQN